MSALILALVGVPPFVRDALARNDLVEMRSVAQLPAALRSGNFTVHGKTFDGWTLANPHAAWQETDVIMTPGLPVRRLVFAACDATFCILHYERGGIGYSAHIVALERDGAGYRMLWHAWGAAPFKSFTELRRGMRSSAQRYESADETSVL